MILGDAPGRNAAGTSPATGASGTAPLKPGLRGAGCRPYVPTPAAAAITEAGGDGNDMLPFSSSGESEYGFISGYAGDFGMAGVPEEGAAAAGAAGSSAIAGVF